MEARPALCLIRARSGKDYSAGGMFGSIESRPCFFDKAHEQTQICRVRGVLCDSEELAPFVMGLLIALTAMVSCVLYFHGSDRAERAAIAMGGTFIGMLLVSVFVCRR